MNKSIKVICLQFIAAASMYSQVYMDMAMDTSMTFHEIVEEGEKFYENYGRGQHTGYKGFKRWQYWMKRCLDENGTMLSNAKANEGFSNFQNVTTDPAGTGMNPIWTDMGPTESTNTTGWSSHLGRVSAIAVDDQDNDHIIVGSPTGGIWESYDCGGTWVPIYDQQSNLNIYSLAISPHNPDHYFAGTWGAGIMRSLDGGDTWYNIPSIPHLSRIVDIKVNPMDPNNVLAINEGGNVFQSRDGGDLFANTLLHNATLYDIEFKPGSADIVYAAGTNGVYRSEDAGWSFTEVSGPWQGNTIQYNPMMLAVTPHDPEYLYVLEGDNGGFGNLYLSQNGGQSFSVQSNDASNDNNIMGYVKTVKGGQAPRDMDIVVSPTDKTEVHIGGVMSYRSFDSGVNWEQTSHWLTYDPLPFIHADIDIIQYKDGRLYFGTDGGIFVSDDRATSFIDKTAGLSIRQFYRFTISEDGELIVAGSQDNGTSLHTDSRGWVDFIGADGMVPVVDRYNKNVIYACIQYGYIYKTEDGGLTRVGGAFPSPGTGDWVTPFAQDPLVPHTFYQGKQQLHKSVDSTQNWAPISNFVMSNPADTIMQEFAIADSDNKYIIVGYEEQAFKTTDGGTTWTDVTPPVGFTNVNYISLHPNDKNWIVMTLSGTSSRLVQSTDGGNTWVDIMGNLPNLAAECVVYEGGPKNGMYVAMDPGVYYRNSDNNLWTLVSQGMPNVLVSELRINGCDLYAATYGRGIWKTGLLDDSMVYVDADGDGFGSLTNSIQYCESGSGYITTGGDCDDSNPNINPNTPEICNGVDDNCNGFIDALDQDFSGQLINWYADSDGDGEGDINITMVACTPPLGYVRNSNDCNDSDASISSIAVELCDGLDNNCNGLVDDIMPGSSIGQIWYLDSDGDGEGDNNNSTVDCQQPIGYVSNNFDCNDSDATVYSVAAELCDGLDNNCNGLVDDLPAGSSLLQTWYLDADQDGEGDNNSSISACQQPSGYVSNNTDCDDQNANIYSNAIEQCDGIDNNCNGVIDDLPPVAGQTWYLDSDGDGEGDSAISVVDCLQPPGYVSNNTDCNDSDATIYTAALELCDGVDNNCDGVIDENCDMIDCDGNFLFIHRSFQEVYSAGTTIYSDAELKVDGKSQNFNAGSSIELLPGFEVEQGKQFQATIRPCDNGVSPVQRSLTNELSIIDEDLKMRINKGELIRVEIIEESSAELFKVVFTKSDINLRYMLSQLPTGRYVIFVESNSLQWNREFDVITDQTR